MLTPSFDNPPHFSAPSFPPDSILTLDPALSMETLRFVEECLSRAQSPGWNVYSGANATQALLAILSQGDEGSETSPPFAFEAAVAALFDAQGNRRPDFKIKVAALDVWVSVLPVCVAQKTLLIDEYSSLATVGAGDPDAPLRELPTVRPYARALVAAQKRFVERVGADLAPATREALARQDCMENEQAELLVNKVWIGRCMDANFLANMRFVAQSKLAAALRELLGNPRTTEPPPSGAASLDHVVTELPEDLRATVDAVALNVRWARRMPETFARAEALALRAEVDAPRDQTPTPDVGRKSHQRL